MDLSLSHNYIILDLPTEDIFSNILRYSVMVNFIAKMKD